MTDQVIERLEQLRESAYSRLAAATKRLEEARHRVVDHTGRVRDHFVKQVAEYQIAAEALKRFADASEAALAHARKDLSRREAERQIAAKILADAQKLDREADKLRAKLAELEAQAAEHREQASIHQQRAAFTAQELAATREQVEASRARTTQENSYRAVNSLAVYPVAEIPAYLEGLAL